MLRLRLQQHELVPAFAQAEEQRTQEGDRVEPGGDLDPDGHRAAHGAHHEPDREDKDVEEDDLLEDENVSNLHAKVTARHRGEGRAQQVSRHQADRDEHRRDCERQAGWHQPGGDRTVLLRRMEPILGKVAHVVDEIDGARQERKQDERRRRPFEGRPHLGREESPLIIEREDEARKDEQVLDPLPGPHPAQKGRQNRDARSCAVTHGCLNQPGQADGVGGHRPSVGEDSRIVRSSRPKDTGIRR